MTGATGIPRRRRDDPRSRGRRAAVAIAVILMLGGTAPSLAASPSPASATGRSDAASMFRSPVYPYTMALPPGWRSIAASPEDTGDLFEGPGATARVGSRGPVPGQTIADRVAANRAELASQACTSDPGADRPATLGGEVAIAWSFECDGASTLALNTIHEDAGYRLSVTVSKGSAAEAVGLLGQLSSTFTFVSAVPSPDPDDLAAIDASLQGTWRTEWAPMDLWIASVVAAGLDPHNGGDGWKVEDQQAHDTHRATVRFEDGQMIEYGASDGGADEFGSQVNYHLVDRDTIEAIDSGVGIRTRYDFLLRDDVLSIDVASDSDPSDLVPQTSIFETLPFTRVP
jgi:hypothetical protein